MKAISSKYIFSLNFPKNFTYINFFHTKVSNFVNIIKDKELEEELIFITKEESKKLIIN